MGGYGSGRGGWASGRCTVEECMVLNGYLLLPEIIKNAGGVQGFSSGIVKWHYGDNAPHSNIRYVFNAGNLTIDYVIKSTGEKLNYFVPLESTFQPKGNVRYWFLCPLQGCNRMTAKLYLPSGARYFGCRHCYNLTYESCNESHRFDSLYRSMARQAGVSFSEAKRSIQEMF
jgi:hypothetical protein